MTASRDGVTTLPERVRGTRRRRKAGLRLLHVEISERELDAIAARGYEVPADRGADPRAVARAVEAFVSDTVSI